MPNLYRKHPVSVAVSMALLAAAATSARAAEPDAAANTPAQSPAEPDASELDTVTVYGVRQSQIRAIEVKRKAASIQDSISAESIQRGLSANTASGEVTAIGIEGGRVECKSVSGDVRAERIYPELARRILGETTMPWAWEYDWLRAGRP